MTILSQVHIFQLSYYYYGHQSIKQSKQIYDQLSKHKKKEEGVYVFGKTANDQILQAYVEMQSDKEYGNFIKYFFVNDKGKPGIICFQEWQIAYTKRMCAFNPIKCSITRNMVI